MITILSLLKNLRFNHILILVVCVLFFLLSLIYKQNQNLKNKNEDLKVLSNYDNMSSKSWRDEFNRSHYRSNVAELNSLASVKNNEVLNAQLKENLKLFSEVKKNQKNLEKLITTKSILSIQKSIKLKDTTVYVNDTQIVAKSFSFSDKWLSISGTVLNDSIKPKIDIKDTLLICQYWKRRWFLGRKKSKFEVVSKNPYVTIKGVTFVSVKR